MVTGSWKAGHPGNAEPSRPAPRLRPAPHVWEQLLFLSVEASSSTAIRVCMVHTRTYEGTVPSGPCLT